MSVLQFKGRTTQSQQDFDHFNLSTDSLIFTNAHESGIENYSLEITLGEGWNESYSEENKRLIKIDDKIKIGRHGSIVVESFEEIRMPHNKYGVVLPTGSMFLSNGILIAPAKIEPSFHGRLKLRLFNTTGHAVSLRKQTKLASVIFFSTENTSIHTVTYRKSDISEPRPSKFIDFKRWLEQNRVAWIASFSSSAIVAIIGFSLNYFLYYKPILEKQTHIAPTSQPQPTSGSKGNQKGP